MHVTKLTAAVHRKKGLERIFIYCCAKMASSSSAAHDSVTVDQAEIEKIDRALRIPGFYFQPGKFVIGRKRADLMIALGALDIRRNCAGKQRHVVQRLRTIFQAILDKDVIVIDINQDAFYEAALVKISMKHPEISQHLSASSLRYVVEHYRHAFYHGQKKQNRDVPTEATGPTERATHTSARAKLIELVGDWSRAQSMAWRDKDEQAKKKLPVEARSESMGNVFLRLRQDCKVLQVNIKQHEEENTALEQQKAILEQENAALERENARLNKMRVKAENQSREQADRHKAQIEQLDTRSDRMRDRIVDMDDEIASLRRQLDTDEDNSPWRPVRDRPEYRGMFPPGGPRFPGY